MSGERTGEPMAANGAVLRGVAVVGDARPLPRPHGGRAVAMTDQPVQAGGSPSSRDAAPAGASGGRAGASELAAAYERGLREGHGQGQAAQRAAEEARVRSACEAGHAEGVQAGRVAGHREGCEAGRLEAEREAERLKAATSARLDQLDQLIAGFSGELARRLEAATDDMVALCHQVVCRVLGEQLVTRDGIAGCVRQAVGEVRGQSLGVATQGAFTIHLHPRDLAALESDAQLAAWIREHASADGVQWLADERVRLGGCIVRTSEGSLDARLETQMAALRQLLLQGAAPGAVGAAGSLPAPAQVVPTATEARR